MKSIGEDALTSQCNQGTTICRDSVRHQIANGSLDQSVLNEQIVCFLLEPQKYIA